MQRAARGVPEPRPTAPRRSGLLAQWVSRAPPRKEVEAEAWVGALVSAEVLGGLHFCLDAGC